MPRKKYPKVRCPKCGEPATYRGYSPILQAYLYYHGRKAIGKSGLFHADICQSDKDGLSAGSAWQTRQ